MPNGKPKTAWIVIYEDPGRETEYVVWLKEEDAYEAAASFIESAAKYDLEGIEWEEDDLNADRLKEALEAIRKKDWKYAYAAWEEYAQETDPQENITIIDAPIGE